MPHRGAIGGANLARVDRRDRLRLRRSIDGHDRGTWRNGRKTIEQRREHRRPTGEDSLEAVETFTSSRGASGESLQERGRCDSPARSQAANLIQYRLGADRTRSAQVGVGDDARDARGQVGEQNDWKRGQVSVTWFEREAGRKRLVLRNQEAVRAHHSLRSRRCCHS